MSEKSHKKEILQKLRLLQDEPDLESELFEFNTFASHLEGYLLDPETSTPYTIGLHGEWGSGKTSLLRRVYEQIEDRLLKNDKKWKVVWFDAWEYERTDPVLALMQTIAFRYRGENKQRFKQIVTGLLLVFSDMAIRAHTSLTLKEIQERFESTIKNIPTITEKLKDMIGDGRLIVFIDDLDRCVIENALAILEAVKLFLNAKGVIFVIGVDMTKLERAWELRYHGSETGIREGRDHIEKIFQLKLSLPPKAPEEIESYVKGMTLSLPDKIRNMVIRGCPANPRKIKRVINLIYFLASQIKENDFEEYFPAIVIWCIATVCYPGLSRQIKFSPNCIVQMSLVAYHMQDVGTLGKELNHFKTIPQSRGGRADLHVTKQEEAGGTPSIYGRSLLLETVIGLEYVVANQDSFDFLKSIAEYYSIIIPNFSNTTSSSAIDSTLKEHYDGLGKLIGNIIYKAGLVA